MPVTIIPQVTVDRPFIYLILTADSYEPIFMGHIVEPNGISEPNEKKSIFSIDIQTLK